MGGLREDLAPAKVAKSSDVKEPITVGSVRIHEKPDPAIPGRGKVHFHADQQGYRVAVPVAVWYSAWEKISQQPGEWSYVDREANTAVTVITKVVNNKIDAEISVFPITVGDTFKVLQKFTTGAGAEK